MTPDTGFRHFHDQLGALKQRLLEMSQRAEELVELSGQVLRTGIQIAAPMAVSLFAVADSTMRSMLPFGTTVRPIVESDARNRL